MSRTARLVVAAGAAIAIAGAGHVLAEGEDDRLDGLIRAYLSERDATVEIAPDGQLARRYALDLTGVVPTLEDLQATSGMAPEEMFDYFAGKGPMAHTGGEPAYVWINLLKDADRFLFSNSPQFSQVAHVREFRDQLRRVYAGELNFQDFARWALQSQMFLNRFPSAADRANAAFFLFLGRDSFASEVQVGNMWNGWYVRNPDLPASQAESSADYHVHDFDAARCTGGQVNCAAELWSIAGSSPEVAIEAMVTSTLFSEATVEHYWHRLTGYRMPVADFPELQRALVRGFVDSGHDVNWLIREIATSVAYTQQMRFR